MVPRSCRAFVSSFVFFAMRVAAAEPEPAGKTAQAATDKAPASKPVSTPGSGVISPVLLPRPPVQPAGAPSTTRLPRPTGTTSPTISAVIRAGLPHFDPPKRTATTPDDVYMLPELEVSGDRIRFPSEADALTKAGREQLLRKLYPGASYKGQDPDNDAGPPNYAAQMARDDKRKADMKDLNDLADTMRALGRKSESKELTREIEDTFIRRPTPKEDAMDKSYNHWRR